MTPTLAAQQATTFQRLSGGRLLLNIVTGGDVTEQRRFGDWLDHDERYDRTDEFLTVLRHAMTGRPFDFAGRYYHVAGATVSGTATPTPLYFGGASPAAELVAAKHVDVYLAWGEPPAMVAPRLARMRELAAEQGRQLRFGIRLHTITRDVAADAWRETERFLEQLPDELVDRAQRSLAGSQSVGQQRMRSLHNGSRESLTISPNLWAGYGLVRGGAATTLVGSHSDVADRIEEYHALGFDEFIMSGHPHIEEAHWFGEGVLPILRRRGLVDALPGQDEAQARTVAYAPLNAR